MVAIPTTVNPQTATVTSYQVGERRRSDRVALQPSIPARSQKLGTIELIELGLGGAIIETHVRPENGRVRFAVSYAGERVELRASVYQLNVHELFYCDSVGSKVRFRARILFDNPTVTAINLLYRIIAANWQESSFPDDTVPVS